MKVVITNTTLLNTGDSAIVEATFAILKRAFGSDITFVCYGAQAFASARYRPGSIVRPTIFDQVTAWAGQGRRRKLALLWLLAASLLVRRGFDPNRLALPASLRRTLAEYRAADLVVSAGGTYLVPNYRMMPKVYDFLITLALGRPLVLFTQSLGPFPAGRERALLRSVLRRCRLIMVRDRRSRDHLAELGVPVAQIAVCPDAAFALAPQRIAADRQRTGNPPQIAVSLRDWPFFDGQPATTGMARYLDAVATFVQSVVENENARVTFVSSCQGAPEYWTDDSRMAVGVLDRLPARVRENVAVDRSFRSPGELIERLRPFDVVVATRMHVAILALCAGVPVIPVAYEFKTRELAASLGLGALLQDIECVSADSLARAWHSVRDGGAAYEPGLWRQVAIARNAALASGGLVRTALKAAT